MDAIERRAGHDAVVAMRGAEIIGPEWVLDDDGVGPETADRACQVTAEAARVFHFAVRIAKELDELDAQRPGRPALLVPTDEREALRSHGAVGGPLVTIRDDDIRDHLAVMYELRDRPARMRLGVIRMGDDHED